MNRESCSLCGQPFDNHWSYRYRGKHYCRKCHEQLFSLKVCSVCGQKKKIFSGLKVPVCKICQVKDEPCIRCGKTEYVPGKITEHGPVCNSCSKYFRPYKTCSECQKTTYTVSNRKLEDGSVRLLCQSCYNKLLPTCHSCHKQREAYCYDEEQNPICRICATEGTRVCRQCGQSFPAGMGRICRECADRNLLGRMVRFGEKMLSPYMSGYYVGFGEWLMKRRGAQFASTRIKRYLPYFAELDELADALGRYPSYAETVDELTVARTRENLLVTRYLDESGLIKIDRKVQDDYSNMDMIDRYLDRFSERTWQYELIHAYSEHLHSKLQSKKTSIRSIRLALGPAANLLSYCDHFESEKLANDALNGYLWKHPGQRSSITGFINFAKEKFGLFIALPDWKMPKLVGPKRGHMQLKQLYIDSLKEDNGDSSMLGRRIVLAIEYLHRIGVPENVVIEKSDLKRKKHQRGFFLRLAGKEFYLPREVLN